MTEPGLVIYLNGSSSAGKGTLSRAIQQRFALPFLHVGVDTVFEALHGSGWNQYGPREAMDAARYEGVRWVLAADGAITAIEFGDYGQRLIRGLHGVVAALALEGNNIVVDDVLFEPAMARHAAKTLARLPAYLIGVRCDLAELERRELERGNRLPGLARLLHEQPHRHVSGYDLEVDTTTTPAELCAEQVHAFVGRRPAPWAFRAISGEG